jgi:hypothetical protein
MHVSSSEISGSFAGHIRVTCRGAKSFTQTVTDQSIVCVLNNIPQLPGAVESATGMGLPH